MRVVAFLISIAVAALGAVGVVSPLSYLSIVRRFGSPAGLSAAGALRTMLGASLFFSGAATRVSKVIRTMGVLTFISGLLTPFATLSFLSLPVIPEIRLTDLGLVDVLENRFVTP